MFKKPSIAILSFITLLIGPTAGIFAIALSRAITPMDALYTLISPGFLICLSLSLIFWAVLGKIYMKQINQGLEALKTGNSQQIEITQKAIIFYPKLTLYLAVFSGLLSSFLIPKLTTTEIAQKPGIFFGLSYGLFALIAVLSYILFLQSVEDYTKTVPFSEKYRSMPYLIRVILVFFFTISGLVSGVLASIEVALQNGHSSSLADFSARFFVILILGVFSVVIDNVFLTRGINTRVQALREFTGHLADGDLTKKTMPILSRDEFGQLINLSNIMQINLKRLMLDLKNTVRETSECSNSVGDIAHTTSETLAIIRTGSNEVNAGTNEIFGQITETKVLLESLTGSISTIIPHIEEQAAMSEESTAALTEMTASIKNMGMTTQERLEAAQQLATSSDKGNENLEKTVEAIEKIHGEIKTITEITDLILGIASQTNLLAMNAAIEAAHAGESGKGFAVVADEIRKLAESSSLNSQSIVKAVNEIVSTIQTTLELGGETAQIFDGIHNEMKMLVDSLADISNGVNEVGAGAEQIMSSMISLREHSGMLKTNADKMDQKTNQVKESVEILTSTSEKVVNHSGEISKKSDGASDLEKGLIDNAKVLTHVISDLSSKINDFQT